MTWKYEHTTVEHAVALYDDGVAVADIARRLVIPEPTVRNWIKKVRGPLGAANRSASDQRSFQALLAGGMPVLEAARRMGIGQTTAYRWARAAAPDAIASPAVRARPVRAWQAALAAAADALSREERLAVGRLIDALDGREPSHDAVERFLSERARQIDGAKARRQRKALVSGLAKLRPETDWFGLAPAPAGAGPKGRARTLSRAPDAWPEAWRAQWAAATDPGYAQPGDEIALNPGVLARVSANRRHNLEQAVGLYLGDRDAHGKPPTITPIGVQVWINDCRGRGCRPRTIYAYVEALLAAARVLEPAADWTWLRRTNAHIENLATAAPKRKWEQAPVDPAALWAIGADLANQARRSDPTSRAAVRFRDGLAFMLLASAPVRLENLASIEIGRHLRLPDDSPGWLVFGADETKSGGPSEHPLWPELRTVVDEYLAIYRPRLRDGASTSPALWIAIGGRPLSMSALAERVSRIAPVYLGQPFSPHRARDAVATALAIEHPESPQHATAMLQHRDPASIGDYTEQAGSVGAARVLATASARARAKVRADVHPRQCAPISVRGGKNLAKQGCLRRRDDHLRSVRRREGG